MINYRVENLAAMVEALRSEGVDVERTEEHEYGKFGWIMESANGAKCNSLGHRPRERHPTQAEALKARHRLHSHREEQFNFALSALVVGT